MADIAKHAPVGISIGGSAISAIEPGSVKVNPAVKAALERGGLLTPQVGLSLTAEPMIEFQTTKINLLSAIAAIAGAQSVVLYFRAFSDGAGYGAGYISATIAKGLIVPITLGAQAGAKALLTVQVHPVSSDGDTAPIQIGTSSNTLTATSEVWTLGDGTVGSSLTGVQSASLTWGYEVTKNAGENGHPFPTEAYESGQEARLAITTGQMSAAAQARLNFGSSETTVSQVFRKLAAGGAPSGTYTVTVAKALAMITSMGGRPGAVEIDAACVENSGYLSFA